MAHNPRGAAWKSLVLVACLSSGLAVASPNLKEPARSGGLWSEVVHSLDGGMSFAWSFYAKFLARSSALLRLR
ncbi:MAG: hypothetical protein ACLQDQ_19870 [Myxococcaceae bacterium]